MGRPGHGPDGGCQIIRGEHGTYYVQDAGTRVRDPGGLIWMVDGRGYNFREYPGPDPGHVDLGGRVIDKE